MLLLLGVAGYAGTYPPPGSGVAIGDALGLGAFVLTITRPRMNGCGTQK